MRIALATENYHRIGGTETYVHTVAEQLQRLGHQVRVYSPHPGDMAHLSRARGIDVARLDDLGQPDDVVIAQDAASSYELAGLWPDVPQVYVCHSTMFDLQQPPLVEGTVQAVVVMSERLDRRVAALDADLPVVRMRQPIDAERLAPRGTPSAVPRRALLLGNYLQGDALRLFVDTWGELGVEVVQVGSASSPTLQPEADIAAADIVVGKGRAVLDAMSCGRPAYVYDVWGADGWVTADSYDAIEADGIAGQALGQAVDAVRLRKDLAAYDAAMGGVNRQLVVTHHDAKRHATDLATLCSGLAPAVRRGADGSRELARQVRMRWRAEVEVIHLQASLHEMGNEVARAREAALADKEAVAAAEAETERAVSAEQERRIVVEGERDRARRRGRKLKARERSMRQQRWVRLGEALRLVHPR